MPDVENTNNSAEYEYDATLLMSVITTIADYAREKNFNINQTLVKVCKQVESLCNIAKFDMWKKNDEN